MLQTNTEYSADGSESGSTLAEGVEYVRGVVRQQLLVILSITILAVALGVAYILITPPTFTARAAMIIDRGKAQVQLGGILSEVPVDIMGVESEIQIVKSELVAQAVASKLNLGTDPEFVGPPLGLPGLIQKLRSSLQSAPAPSESLDPSRAAVGRLVDRLKVNRVGYVVEIEFASTKPERAAEVANAVADCYIEDQLKFRSQSAHRAAAWLEERLKDLRDKSVQAEEAVVQFKTSNSIVSADGKLVNDQQVTQLNTQVILAREKTAETRARLDRIESILRASPSKNQVDATVSDTLNNPIIVKLRTQYLELAGRESDWSRRYGTEHLAVVELGRQIREVRTSIDAELRRIAETYKSEHEIAKQRQAELEKSITAAVEQSQDTNQSLIALRQLESSAEAYRTLYRTTLQRNTELIQQQSFPSSEARLITRASTPTSKTSPKTAVILLGSAVAGMMLGLGAGVLRASLDRVFRTPAQVEAIAQAKCLALVPMIRHTPSSARPTGDQDRTMVRDANVFWEVLDSPLSRFAEGLRSIKLASSLSRLEGRPAKAIGFTSSLPNEGKSTMAAALGLLTAQERGRVVLVDCDLRRPALSAMLAPRAEDGLLEVLSGKKTLEQVLWKDTTTNLAFLPTVMKSRNAHSSEVLASAALRTLFEELRRDYDHLIVDFSPIGPIVDVRATAGLVNSYVFVIEWARTKIDVVEHALGDAAVVRDNLLGVVLNKVDLKTLSRYDRLRSDYYSDKYYAPYGQTT